MRVISQSGTMDFPYDNSLVFMNENSLNNEFYVKIQLCGAGATEIAIIAKYSSREKALKAMEMLRERYSNSDLCKDDIQFRAETMVEDVNSAITKFMIDITYFQFPKDEEVEV